MEEKLLVDKIEPTAIGFRKDGRPIYPISGGEFDNISSNEYILYKPNAMKRIGYSVELIEKAINDRRRLINKLRVNQANWGIDSSTEAVIAKFGLEDPTDAEIEVAQASSKTK